jgi:ABC-type sugar transport system substrate-binding protein
MSITVRSMTGKIRGWKMGQKGRPRIGVLMADRSNPFWMDMKKQYNDLAQMRGLKVACFWPSPTHDPSAQSNLLLKMIESGFDAIIVNPLNNNNLVSGIQLASSKKIPIVDVGAKTDRRLFEKIPPRYFPIQTVDFLLQGSIAAEYILRRLGPERKAKVAIVEGRVDSAQSICRAGGAVKVFEGNPNIRLLIRRRADFDRRKARAVAKEIYQEHGGIDAFFCANDLMALGVSDAVSDLKNVERPIIVGVDLIDEAKVAIQKGLLSASVAFSSKKVAAVVLEIAIACMDGLKAPPAPAVPSHLITIESVGKLDD